MIEMQPTISPLPRDASRDPVPESRCPVDNDDPRFDPLDRWFIVENYRVNVGMVGREFYVEVLVDGDWFDPQELLFSNQVNLNDLPGIVGQNVKVPWLAPLEVTT